MKLSRYFTLEELTRSETAQRLGIPNTPGPAETANLEALCRQVLDPLRAAIGVPIRVNSAFRARAVNARIPGASTTSQHLDGMAADIQAPGLAVLDLFQRILRLGLPFDQVIYEAMNAQTKWVHVSFDPRRQRGDIRVARFGPNGRPVGYPPVTREQALAMSEPRVRGVRLPEPGYVEMDDAPAPRARRKPAAKRRATGKSRPKSKRPAPTKKRASAGSRGATQSPRRRAKSPRRTGKTPGGRAGSPRRSGG